MARSSTVPLSARLQRGRETERTLHHWVAPRESCRKGLFTETSLRDESTCVRVSDQQQCCSESCCNSFTRVSFATRMLPLRDDARAHPKAGALLLRRDSSLVRGRVFLMIVAGLCVSRPSNARSEYRSGHAAGFRCAPARTRIKAYHSRANRKLVHQSSGALYRASSLISRSESNGCFGRN